MNTYILVLTLIFKSGYSGMGGVEHIEVKDYKECHRMGKAWVDSVSSSRATAKGDVVFSCIAKEET
jgi:hypothetical protein